MTKQIIIDGVDVSKCDRYITNDGYMGIYKTPVFKGDCKLPHIGKCQGSECLFKRFKRKEQKLEIAKQGLNLILTVQKECTKCPHQELDIDVLVCDLDCATAFKKIAKQTLKTIEDEENV